jgi:anti-anti-sigma regulatory factor
VIVFLSWSGKQSGEAATFLRSWLGDVLPAVDVWMSAHDVKPGSPWGSDLHRHLSRADFGILCLTRENVVAPWLLYEAGCLVMRVAAGRVVPYLLDVEPSALPGPLAQLQGVSATRDGTREMLAGLNAATETPLPPDRLDRFFEKWWPDLERALGLTLSQRIVDGFAVVQVGSNIEDGTGHLPRRVDDLLQRGAEGLVLDLAHAPFLNSASLAQILRPIMVCRRHGKPSALVVQQRVVKQLESSGLGEILRPHGDLASALAAVRRERDRAAGDRDGPPESAPPQPPS